jgi:hypothetical protein
VSGPEPPDFTPPDALVEHLIVKHRLRNEAGTVMCWNCRYRPAVRPQLWCAACLDNRRPR